MGTTMRYGREDDHLVVQPGDRGRTGTRRRLLVRLRRETTATSSPAWCLIGRQSSRLGCLPLSFLRAPFLSFSFYTRTPLSSLTCATLVLSLSHKLSPPPSPAHDHSLSPVHSSLRGRSRYISVSLCRTLARRTGLGAARRRVTYT